MSAAAGFLQSAYVKKHAVEHTEPGDGRDVVAEAAPDAVAAAAAVAAVVAEVVVVRWAAGSVCFEGR